MTELLPLDQPTRTFFWTAPVSDAGEMTSEDPLGLDPASCASANTVVRALRHCTPADIARVVVADPPWSFSDKLPGATRGAARNYGVLSQQNIEGFLPSLISSGAVTVAQDAVLFCWRVASQVEEAYRVVRTWGFTPKSEIVWRKLTTHGKAHFGMGRIVRASHEVCVVATRGKVTPKVRTVRSVFEATVGIHSEKPEVFFDIVEELFDGPYLELFARRQRPGWTCLGDQMPPAPGETGGSP